MGIGPQPISPSTHQPRSIVETMSRIEIYRTWFEQEKDSNAKMLEMLRSTPPEKRQDERYHRALVLAHHLAACRENWLDRMIGGSANQVDWWPETAPLDTLDARYAK